MVRVCEAERVKFLEIGNKVMYPLSIKELRRTTVSNIKEEEACITLTFRIT